jgi:hypothetical protein
MKKFTAILLSLALSSCANQHRKPIAPVNIPKPQIANIKEQSTSDIKNLDDTLNSIESRVEKIKILLNSIN